MSNKKLFYFTVSYIIIQFIFSCTFADSYNLFNEPKKIYHNDAMVSVHSNINVTISSNSISSSSFNSPTRTFIFQVRMYVYL